MIDDDGRLLLIKRTKPGQAPYWTTPGGGVEDTDESVEAALQRELAEELGVEASAWPAACTPCSSFRKHPQAVLHFSSWRAMTTRWIWLVPS